MWCGGGRLGVGEVMGRAPVGPLAPVWVRYESERILSGTISTVKNFQICNNLPSPLPPPLLPPLLPEYVRIHREYRPSQEKQFINIYSGC